MHSLIISLILLFLTGCSSPHVSVKNEGTITEKNDPYIFAIGYIEDLREFSDEVYNIFKTYLPAKYTSNPLFMTTLDVNFNVKEVDWHLGFGGTVFAMKEIGAGINFFPMMWENNCDTSLQFFARGEVKPLSKYKKILIYHNDYPSPLALTQLYSLKKDKHQFYESDNELLAKDALTKRKVDLIITETFLISTPKNKRQMQRITFDSQNIHTKTLKEIRIPCRSLFYSPKLSDNEREEVINTLQKHEWQNKGHKLGRLREISNEEWQKKMSLFNWKQDDDLRLTLKKLSK